MIKAAYAETDPLAIRQMHTAMHKARAMFQKCRHIHNHLENSQLTEATSRRFPSVKAELSSNITKVCEKAGWGTSTSFVYFLLMYLLICPFALQPGLPFFLQNTISSHFPPLLWQPQQPKPESSLAWLQQ